MIIQLLIHRYLICKERLIESSSILLSSESHLDNLMVYLFKLDKSINIFMNLLFCCFVALVQASTLTDFKEQMEEKVTTLANQMSKLYARRCENTIINCQVKSFNQCLGTDQKICRDDFPKPPSCLSGGVYLSQNSAVRFPNDLDINSLTDQQRQFICSSALMQPYFHDLDNDRQSRFGLAYIGTPFGSFRQYPASIYTKNLECLDYDPRYRPWYVSATSGGKNVILIIDISESMESDNKIGMAKEAAKNVINTLSNNDFIGIVTFSTDAHKLLSSKITRATISHKQELTKAIDELTVYGGTNYEVAFKLGFEMLKSAQEDQFGVPCVNSENVMLFLTDGFPGQGAKTINEISSVIDQLNTFNIKIFTYGLGSSVQSQLLKDIACRYNGIMYMISDLTSNEQLSQFMKSYYIYLSEGISVVKPIWTEPYEDQFGFGRIITVSMPIYYEQGSIRTILGVAALDISVDYAYQQFGLKNQTELIQSFMSDSVCYNNSLTYCELEHLRVQKCSINNCTEFKTIQACMGQTNTQIFVPEINTNQSLCCGFSIGGLIGLIIGIIIALHIVVGASVVIYCLYCRSDPRIHVPSSQEEVKH